MKLNNLVKIFAVASALIAPALCADDNVTATGPIQALTDNTVTVDGKTFTLTEDTEFEHGSRDDLAVGVLVKVEGHEREGVLVAKEIVFLEEEYIYATGPIQELTDTTVTVDGKTFTLTEDTEFEHGSWNDLAVGVVVTVKGSEREGVLFAKKIKFHEDEPKKPEKVEARGPITAFTGESLTVSGITFRITDETHYKHGGFSDLEIGVVVEVEGLKFPDGRVVAKKIEFKEDDHGKKRKVEGVIREISRDGDGNITSLTLGSGKTIDVSPDLRVDGRHGLPATANSLIEGLKLSILVDLYDSTSESGAIGKAKQITVKESEKIKGTIDGDSTPTVDLPFITVDGRVVYYDSLTVVIGASGGVSNPGDLEVGTRVKVLANELADGSFLGNKVIVNDDGEPHEDRRIRLRGEVTAITRSGDEITDFTVNSTKFLAGAGMKFKVAGYEGPFTADDFEVGQKVRVKGSYNSDGDPVAHEVKIYLPTRKYCGEIEAIGTDTLTVLGVESTVTEWTKFDDFGPGVSGLADLAVGDRVEVRVIQWPDGSLIAAEIEPCDDFHEEVKGMIETLTTNPDGSVSLTVAGVDVLATADTKISRKKVKGLGLTDLEVGQRVSVEGTFDDSGVLQATKIKIH